MRPGCGLEFGVCWGCIAEHTLLVAKTAENSPEHRLHKPSSTNKVRRGGALARVCSQTHPQQKKKRDRERERPFSLPPRAKQSKRAIRVTLLAEMKKRHVFGKSVMPLSLRNKIPATFTPTYRAEKNAPSSCSLLKGFPADTCPGTAQCLAQPEK